MTDYTKSTNFASKDSLSTGNALKIVKGTELDAEFNNLVTAVATKANSLSPTFTGTPAAPTASLGTNTTQLATTAFVIANASPSGSITMWPTATAPTGFLLCAGTAVSRSTYAALFALLGTSYGVGDGSTTFNLPNFNNRSPIGAGGLYTAAQTLGSKDAVVVTHTHTATSTVTDPTHAHSYTIPASPGASGSGGLGSGGSGTTGSASTGITVATTNSSEGVSGTDANLQPSLGIFFIIKT
jgi:microcystin-dependent protein